MGAISMQIVQAADLVVRLPVLLHVQDKLEDGLWLAVDHRAALCADPNHSGNMRNTASIVPRWPDEVRPSVATKRAHLCSDQCRLEVRGRPEIVRQWIGCSHWFNEIFFEHTHLS